MRKLPEFLEFVKEVQCFVVAALKSNGVERKGKIDEKPRTSRHGRWDCCKFSVCLNEVELKVTHRRASL